MKYDNNVIQHMESDIYFLTYMSQSNGVTHFSARLCHDNKVTARCTRHMVQCMAQLWLN